MFKVSHFLWSLAALGTASTGLFLGSIESAHSDITKFQSLLAQHDRVPGEVIVKVKPSAMLKSQAEIFDAGRFTISEIKPFETNKEQFVIKLKGDQQTAQYLAAAASNPDLEYAEPNYILRITGQRDSKAGDAENIPNDTDFGLLWGMKNTGQKEPGNGVDGKAGADISATKAWAVTTGNREISVSVIDTGVDYNHNELKNNIFVNTAEIAGNGIDDDANGFIDDVHGWNFAGVSTNDPMDDNEHGTHCSGTIGAGGNDGNKIAGVTWNVRILPVKFLTGGGSGTLADAVKAIQYSTKMKVNIMSNSWGGGGFSQAMFDAIKEAKDAGILFIAAAGNDGQNSDNSPHYPAGYQVENVMAIAASTNLDTLASFSTYGKRTVHLAAPGHKIYSSVPKDGYDTFSGTSMATPHVSGAAALLWGTNTAMTFAEVKDRLMKSRDFIPSLTRKVAASGRLNIYNAIMGVYPPSPEPSEDAWRDFDAGQVIESAHPYANSFKQEWAIQGPEGAKFMRLVLEKVDLEDGYDFLKIVDATGAEMDSISGKAENASTFYVEGNKMTLKFSTDSSEVRWGFKVAKVQVVY